MSSSGCEAMPIESPSSIHSEAPSESVRRYADTASSPSSTSGGKHPAVRERAEPRHGSGTGGDACHPAILVSVPQR